MNGKTIGIIVVVLVILGLGWWWIGSKPAASTNEGASPTGAVTTPTTGTSINPQSQNVTVTYTDQGFSPKSVSIPEGATVTFVNNSTKSMWVASGQHPAHTGYDGTSRSEHCAAGYAGPIPFDECVGDAKGASYSFTFTKAGTWPYHNHSLASDFGSVTVMALVQNGGIEPPTATP